VPGIVQKNPSGCRNSQEARIVSTQREVRVDHADRVAREVQLREHHKVGGVTDRASDDSLGLFQVGVDVAELGIDLRERDPHRSAHVSRGTRAR
jgi:hypothetical protein